MKRCVLFLSLLFALAILVGCRSGSGQTAVIPSIIVPSQTAPAFAKNTVTATATATAGDPAREPTGSPTPHLIALPTTTALPTPLPTGKPAELPLPPRTEMPGNGENYELARPNPKSLLDIIDIIRERQGIVYGYSGDFQWSQPEVDRWDWLINGVTFENKAVLEAIDNVFTRAYPSALPEPGIVLEEQRIQKWTRSNSSFVAPYPPRYLVNVLISKINQSGETPPIKEWADSTFPDDLGFSQFAISASPAELDGKPDREWIIFFHTPYTDVRYTGLQLWQAVDELPGPTYQTIGEPVIAERFFYADTFAARDISGDGLTDLITRGVGMGFGQQRTNFTIYQWTGKGFKQLSYLSEWVDMSMAMEDENGPRYQVTEDSGLPALRIVEDINKSWGCVYQKIKTYRWPGGREQLQETNSANPNSPACLLADARNVSETGAAIRAYQRALSGLSAQDPQNWPMISYAHYRLAVLYAAQGNDRLARQHLQPLLEGFQDNLRTAQYLKSQLAPLLNTERVPVIALCNLGFQAKPEDLKDWYSGLYYPFYYGGPFPEDICNPQSTAHRLLENAPREDEEALRNYLQASGAKVAFVQSFQIPEADQRSWMVQMDTGWYASTVFAYLPLGDEWKWNDFASIASGNELFTVLAKDVTGDGAVDIGLATPTDAGEKCESGLRFYTVYLAGQFERNFPHYLKFQKSLCLPEGEPVNLEAVLADQDGDGLSDRVAQEAQEQRSDAGSLENPDWPVDKPRWYDSYEILKKYQQPAQQEQALFSALYRGANPAQTRSQLLHLRATMLPDNPGQHADQQIDYLIALSYELEGNQQQAVRGYLALTQQQPQTMWTSLAATRLKKK